MPAARTTALSCVFVLCVSFAGAACSAPTAAPTRSGEVAPHTTSTTSDTAVPTPTTPAPTSSFPPRQAPWTLGAHPLPTRADGYGRVLPTPPQLVDRDLPTRDLFPPPSRYTATVHAVPPDVLARSTWQPGCPVAVTDLAYLTMSFWGYDARPHTGEMIVNRRVATAVTRVFATLYAAHFPIEEMRVTARSELTAPPTGDGNNTTAFVCRPTVGQTNWSAHASGLALDLDPFCNPYTKGDLVLPELSSAYLNRANVRPGMILAGGAAVRAFTAIGWTWGGTWHSPRDIMHFSATGH